MTKIHSKILGYSALAGLIVLADEIIKFLALQRLPDEGSLSDPGFLALAIHKNYGIAFNIPFRMPFILLVSLIIGVFLIQIIYKNWSNHPRIAFMALLIVLGAIGNLYDRIVYGFTVDYLILGQRLAINISDLVILTGVGGLLLNSRRKKGRVVDG